MLAGSADFKNDLHASDIFDQRLVAKVIKTVDVSYGGENGFNQARDDLPDLRLLSAPATAPLSHHSPPPSSSSRPDLARPQAIELSSETLSNVKFVQEKKLISKYFEEISQDTGKFCFGISDTLKGLEMGAVETLIVYENEPTMRYTLKHAQTGEEKVRSPLERTSPEPPSAAARNPRHLSASPVDLARCTSADPDSALTAPALLLICRCCTSTRRAKPTSRTSSPPTAPPPVERAVCPLGAIGSVRGQPRPPQPAPPRLA